MKIEDRLKTMGVELPEPPKPAGNYIGAVTVMDRLVYLAVHGPHTPEGYGCKLDAALRIPEQAAAWAKLQPEMLVVDRGSIDFSVGRQMHPMPYDGSHYGSAEAYVTPEGGYGFKTDPKIPWETCLTMVSARCVPLPAVLASVRTVWSAAESWR